MSKYLIYAGSKDSAGLVYKILEIFGEDNDWYEVGYPFDIDKKYTHKIFKDFEGKLIASQEGLHLSLYKTTDCICSNFMNELTKEFLAKEKYR